MKLFNDAYRYKNITFLLRKHSFVIAICATVYTKENKAVSPLFKMALFQYFISVMLSLRISLTESSLNLLTTNVPMMGTLFVKKLNYSNSVYLNYFSS